MAARPSGDPLNQNVTTKALPRAAGRCFILRFSRRFLLGASLSESRKPRSRKSRPGALLAISAEKNRSDACMSRPLFPPFFLSVRISTPVENPGRRQMRPSFFSLPRGWDGQHKHECVVPGGRTLGNPVAYDIQIVFGKQL